MLSFINEHSPAPSSRPLIASQSQNSALSLSTMDVCCSGVNNYGAEISYYDEAFDHVQLWNASPVLLQMQLDELNMIMESMDSPYQIPNQSPLPFSSRTDTADSRSSSSSSASSVPSSSSTMTSRTNQSHDPSAGISHGHAFQPYGCMISGVMEINREEKAAVSQNMMKKAHSMLRNMKLLKEEMKTEEWKPAVNQKQHMASERRRRERLNAGYHSLRKLLPPGSKKDKSSVLRKTLSCIKTLKTEVQELQEENQIIQQHFPSSAAAAPEHYYIFSGERVEVQIIDRSKEASQVGPIDLVVMVRVPCDLVRVVLRVLECIRGRRDLSLLWLDAGPGYTHDQMSVCATLKLAIQGSTWNERTFKELVTGAALMALNA